MRIIFAVVTALGVVCGTLPGVVPVAMAAATSVGENSGYFRAGGLVVLPSNVSATGGDVNGEFEGSSSAGFSIALGSAGSAAFAFEIEGLYWKQNFDTFKGSVFGVPVGVLTTPGFVEGTTGAVMGNVFWRPTLAPNLYPYFGGGVGLVKNTLTSSLVSGEYSSTELGYQGLLGMVWEFTPGFGARFGFRYITTPKWRSGATEISWHATALDFGLTTLF